MATTKPKPETRVLPFKEGLSVRSPIPLQVRELANDNDSGSGSGCGNVTGYMDSYGTMTTTTSFNECLDYLFKSGFLADGHGAAYNYHYPQKAEIGIFTDVHVDYEGLQLEWEYHDDHASQACRMKTQKRMSNDKTCGLSIGFFVGDGKNSPKGWDYNPKEEQPDDIDYICVSREFFDEVVRTYSKPEFVNDNLQRSEQFFYIYILLRVHVFETSQTEIPANEISLITEVRQKRTSISQTQNKPITMAAKKEEEDSKRSAKMEECRDALENAKRAFKKAKDAHTEHDDDMRGHLSRAEKAIKEAYAKLDDDSKGDDDEGDKKKPSEEAKGKRLFERGTN